MGKKLSKLYGFSIKIQSGTYQFKEEFNTQRKIADYFKDKPDDISEKLISLCANVLFLTEEKMVKRFII
ncbi:hypothetical protein, partial [Chryseobacterium indoltheticum]|uniref:hypothetical protein n=1 Tax=Chryseobacterium indoltheticum TaxID=254 RepID=UPI003F4942E6